MIGPKNPDQSTLTNPFLVFYNMPAVAINVEPTHCGTAYQKQAKLFIRHLHAAFGPR